MSVIATGARWRKDGVGRWHSYAVTGFEGERVLTPDDIMEGKLPTGPVVVFDDDHYYMGGVLAERLRRAGLEVTLVTPAELASIWTANTLELQAYPDASARPRRHHPRQPHGDRLARRPCGDRLRLHRTAGGDRGPHAWSASRPGCRRMRSIRASRPRPGRSNPSAPSAMPMRPAPSPRPSMPAMNGPAASMPRRPPRCPSAAS